MTARELSKRQAHSLATGQYAKGKSKRRGNAEHYAELGRAGGKAAWGKAKVRGTAEYYRLIASMRGASPEERAVIQKKLAALKK